MKPSLSDRAYNLIKRDIIRCAFEPGQQIIQKQLAERYGLGTTPVREALQRLAQEGFVQPIPRFGYTVRYVALSDVHEIYELRLILEPAAARLAASRASTEQLERIALCSGLTSSYPPGGAHIHNADFHRSVVAACGNARLHDATLRVLDELTGIFHLGLDLSSSLEEMQAEHTSLVAALQEHEPDRAEHLMRDQILHSRQLVLDALVRRYTVITQAIGLEPLTRSTTELGSAVVQQPTAGRGSDGTPSSLPEASNGQRQASRAAGVPVR
jgi:DNA-binding GntR family transcriptional regulator